jgi:hypothetical protein
LIKANSASLSMTHLQEPPLAQTKHSENE